MSCHLTRDQAILWKKPIDDLRGDLAAYFGGDLSRVKISVLGRQHCSSCDHEYQGNTDCPECGGEAF